MENEDIKVIINGEVIPPERIKRDGERIIILDEDGEEMESVPMIMHITDGVWSLGDDKLKSFWTGVGDYEKALEKYRSFDKYEDLIQQYGSFFKSHEGWEAFGQGETPKVMIGVILDKPGEALCKHLDLDADAVTLISGLYKGLPAEKAGLEQYDIILKIDGKTPADPETIQKLLADQEPGDVVQLTVIQAGKRKNFEIELAPYDAEAMKKDIMIGRGPDILTWSFAGPDQMRFIRPEELVRPKIDRFIFKPEGRDEMIQQFVMPKVDMKVQEKLKSLREGEEGQQEDIAQLNQKLRERLAELEKKLEKLMKRVEQEKE
jgi:hypothetical protein